MNKVSKVMIELGFEKEGGSVSYWRHPVYGLFASVYDDGYLTLTKEVRVGGVGLMQSNANLGSILDKEFVGELLDSVNFSMDYRISRDVANSKNSPFPSVLPLPPSLSSLPLPCSRETFVDMMRAYWDEHGQGINIYRKDNLLN